MSLHDADLLRRLFAELEGASSFQLLGIDGRGVDEAVGARTVAAGAAKDCGPVELLVVAATAVSASGDLVPTAAAAERAVELGTTVRELAAAAVQVLAVLARPGPSAARPSPNEGLALTERCTGADALPGIATRILCPWAVLDVTPDGLVIRELASNVCARSLQAAVPVPLKIASDVVELSSPVPSPSPGAATPAGDEL